jgi:hypothetical protein
VKIVGTWSDSKAPTFTESNVTEVDMSEVQSLTTLPHFMFFECEKLGSVKLPNGLEKISERCFSGCSGLSEITIPESVKEIDTSAFYKCSGLSKVNITNLTAWCNISFEKNANPLAWAKHLYLNGEEIKDLVIPDGCTAIKDFAFVGGTEFTSVTIPSSVTSIGDSAFDYCTGLTKFKIPANVVSVGNYAFQDCASLDYIDVEGAVTFGYDVFYESGLYALILRSNEVCKFDQYTFNGCFNLDLYVQKDLVSSYNNVGSSVTVKSIEDLPEKYK